MWLAAAHELGSGGDGVDNEGSKATSRHFLAAPGPVERHVAAGTDAQISLILDDDADLNRVGQLAAGGVGRRDLDGGERKIGRRAVVARLRAVRFVEGELEARRGSARRSRKAR